MSRRPHARRTAAGRPGHDDGMPRPCRASSFCAAGASSPPQSLPLTRPATGGGASAAEIPAADRRAEPGTVLPAGGPAWSPPGRHRRLRRRTCESSSRCLVEGALALLAESPSVRCSSGLVLLPKPFRGRRASARRAPCRSALSAGVTLTMRTLTARPRRNVRPRFSPIEHEALGVVAGSSRRSCVWTCTSPSAVFSSWTNRPKSSTPVIDAVEDLADVLGHQLAELEAHRVVLGHLGLALHERAVLGEPARARAPCARRRGRSRARRAAARAAGGAR